MWEERAHKARRDISAMAASGLGLADLHARALRLIGETVRADLTCWASIDPETLVISSMVGGDNRIAPPFEPILAAAEYSGREPHTFATLATRRQQVARLSDLPARDRARSSRFNEVWRPLGLDREVRVMFLVEGACWGAAGIARTGADFTEREVEFLAAVAPAVAAATRLAVRTEVRAAVIAGPAAVVVVGRDGRLRSATPAAHVWRERLDEMAPHRFSVMMRLMAAGALAAPTGSFRARMHDGRGGWAVLRASPLVGQDDEEVAVSVEPAAGDELVGLLLLAYGLTAREREVCREVMAGRSTVEIAGRLFISANTVQDHLKSVFAKVGVRSRGELVARLRPGTRQVS